MTPIYPCPKPPKGRKPGKIVRTNRSDGSAVEVCRTEHQWQKRRREVWDRDGGKCQACGVAVPLHDVRDEETGEIRVPAAEIHHKKHRRMGGGSRDDSLDNLVMSCQRCHSGQHVAAKVVPSKRAF